MSNAYCSAPECERETSEGRTYCDAHWKQLQRGKKLKPIAEPLTTKQRLLEAACRWIETDPEDDQAYDANERAVTQLARQMGRTGHADAVREGMTKARSRGVRLGRPPKVADKTELVLRLVRKVGVTMAAEVLSVSRQAIWRMLRKDTFRNVNDCPRDG